MRVQWVEDPKAIELLVDRSQMRYLIPFLGKEASLSEASAHLSVPLANLHYPLKRLLALGLIAETRREKRQGRSVRYFQSVAEEFFVPGRILPAELVISKSEAQWHRRYVSQLVAELLNVTARLPMWGLRVARHPTLGVQITLASEPGVNWAGNDDMSPALVFDWVTLELPAHQAKALQQDMRALLARYAALQQQGSQRYLLHLGLVTAETPE